MKINYISNCCYILANNIPLHVPFLSIRYLDLHLHWYDPGFSWHFAFLPHMELLMVHSLISVLQSAPSQPGLHTQEPLFLPQLAMLVVLQLHDSAQYAPYVLPGQSKSEKVYQCEILIKTPIFNFLVTVV